MCGVTEAGIGAYGFGLNALDGEELRAFRFFARGTGGTL